MSTAGGKKLADLRVADLKDELEKRSLETTGNKIALVERLQKALKEEGKDPEKYLFEQAGKRATPIKKPAVKIKTEEPEEKTADDSVDDGDVVVVDEVGIVDEDDGQNMDADNNDNEESINLTIEEEEQNLLHQQAQDGKDDSKKGADADSSTCNNNVIKIKEEKEDEPECEDSVAENAEEDAGENGETNAEGETEDNGEGEQKKDDSDQSSAAKTTVGKDEKDKTAAGASSPKKSAASSSRNLWVSGLSSLTRASDLKTIFTKYGKVIGAKVVTNTRTPGTRCYGYVTMASSADASSCIEHLHRTELHGRIISVERTKSEIGSSGTVATKKDDKAKPTNENDDAKVDADKDGSKDVKKAGETATSIDRKKSEARSRKSSRARSDRKIVRSNSRGRRLSPPRRIRRSLDRDRERKRDVLSFQKIREERERQRMRERERELREEERRRRDFRRRQREEEDRLAREREKLRLERERLEREKAELLRLERERQKLEREKIELERLELKRQQMKILQRNEESKRSIKRPATDDRYSSSGGHSESKRSNTDRRFEAPPPPRFDSSLARSVDKKRDDYSSSKRDDYKRDIDVPSSRHTSSSYHGSRDSHKEGRFSIPDPPRSSFRRDDRDSRTSGSKRFEGPSSYAERSSGGGSSSSNWHSSGPPAIKSFAASQMTNNVPSWQSKSSETSNNHWPSQDRYDRTYNERSGPYMDPAPRQSGMFVSSSGGRPQDRYGGMSRYENGKY